MRYQVLLPRNPHKYKWRRETIRRNPSLQWNQTSSPSSIIQSTWAGFTEYQWEVGFEQDTGQNKDKRGHFQSSEGKPFYYHTTIIFTFPLYVSTWQRATDPILFALLRNLRSQIWRNANVVYPKKTKYHSESKLFWQRSTQVLSGSKPKEMVIGWRAGILKNLVVHFFASPSFFNKTDRAQKCSFIWFLILIKFIST